MHNRVRLRCQYELEVYDRNEYDRTHTDGNAIAGVPPSWGSFSKAEKTHSAPAAVFGLTFLSVNDGAGRYAPVNFCRGAQVRVFGWIRVTFTVLQMRSRRGGCEP